jgi:FkbM family methyltransferase
VIDVGANIGDHTIAYLEKTGANGSVVAYEPHPVLYECLCRNCPLAIAFPYALGHETGNAQLYLQDGEDAGSSYLRGLPEDLHVKVSTLDEDLAGILEYRTLSLIKIDAEGCEPEILAGALTTIQRYHPALVLEVNRDALARRGFAPQDIQTFLEQNDYHWSFVDGNWDSVRTDIICA